MTGREPLEKKKDAIVGELEKKKKVCLLCVGFMTEIEIVFFLSSEDDCSYL